MAEWLGSALQKLLQRFESASDLNEQKESPVIIAIAGLFWCCVLTSVYACCDERKNQLKFFRIAESCSAINPKRKTMVFS